MRLAARVALGLALGGALVGAGSRAAQATACDPSAAGTFCGALNGTDTARAVFSASGTDLTLVLTNTSTRSAYVNGQVLSGLFFDIGGSPSLHTVSATASGLVDPSGGAQDVGSHWGFQTSSTGYKLNGSTLTTAQYGVAAAGYSSLSPSFGSPHFFSSSSGKGPQKLQGLDYSIVGADFTSINGNGAGTLVEDSVTFRFSGLPSGFALSNIGNVTFAYGTAPDGSAAAQRPTTTGTSESQPVPEPGSLVLLLSGVVGLAAYRRRTVAARAA